MSCLKCLKHTMCFVNFLFFVCGASVFGFGIYMMTISKFSSLIPSAPSMNVASTLFITGIIITCVSFMGFMGALKENRCLLITFFILLFLLMLVELAAACVLLVYEKDIDDFFKKDLNESLEKSKARRINETGSDDWDVIQKTLHCCGVHNVTDWKDPVPPSCNCTTSTCETKYWKMGCYNILKDWFEQNFLSIGVGVIVVCSIEVLGMCFSMTLFCHISRSGLGYK